MEERSRNRYDHPDPAASRHAVTSGRSKVYVERVRPIIPVRIMQRRVTWPNFAAAVRLFALLVVSATCSPTTTLAQTANPVLSALAADAGPGRTAKLIDGAKKEGTLTLYSSATVEDLAALTAAFTKK
jgi:hypothetical protein